MKDSEPRLPPPIPPRRLKRKNKPTVGQTDRVAEDVTTSEIRLEPKPRLPPPPPPQRSLQRREITPQLVPVAEKDTAEKCQSQSITGGKLAVSDIQEVQPHLSTFGKNVRLLPMAKGCGKKSLTGEDPPRRKREKGRIPRPDEYPPLFFTLKDFQDVMSDVENSYSRTLKNMTTFEPTPRPRTSRISRNDQFPETPEHKEVLFRVTTTNLPFEKSTSEWGEVGNDPDHFIFEEYVDRRQIPAQSKSRSSNTKLVLFGDDTFDRDDEEQTVSTNHTASRVRFLVDSSSRDLNVDKTELDSLQNIDSLPLDSSPSQDLMLEDNPTGDKEQDEFGDVPFDSLLNIADDPFMDPSEDSTSSKTDFQTILVTAMVEPIPLAREVKKPCEEDGKVHESNAESLEDKNAPFLGEEAEEETLKDEDARQETRSPIFLSQNLESDLKFETQEKRTVFELSGGRDEGVKSIDRREERRKIPDDKLIGDLISVDNLDDKSPLENVRRNSFLMNMLQEDEGPKENRVVCKVVATHPKTPIHGLRIDCRVGEEGGGDPSAAVEAKSKLLGELSSSFSAIRLKPVNNGVEEVEEKQSASDLKVDSMNLGKGVKKIIVGKEDIKELSNNYQDDKVYDNDNEAENVIKYKLNRNLDSVLDSNVVKCKVSEEPIEGSRKPRNEPRDRSQVCSQKTDDIIDIKETVDNDDTNEVFKESEIESVVEDNLQNEIIKGMKMTEIKIESNDDDVEENINNNMNDGDKRSSVKLMKNNNNKNEKKIVDLASRSSVDKCAIVLKCNNNNDNNAMTPVDVSYDQSPDNVSIIPGSVRSFVKFYEIHGETSVGLNSNEIAATVNAAAMVPKIKVEATGNTADHFQEMCQKNISPHYDGVGVEIENDIKYTIIARKPVLQKTPCNTMQPVDRTIITPNQTFDYSHKSIRPIISKENKISTEHKREIQFYNDLAQIRTPNFVKNELELARIERRKEPRSRSSAYKKIDAIVDVASGIAPGKQDGSTGGVIQDIVRSGTTTNHSVPKSSTSIINEQYTFYCTV